MGFLTPFMLFGAIAAGIPVAIHLFFRSRYRTVPWAAMKFLLTAVEQTSRRLKFQELLLLLLRMAVLIMLAIAFARPISTVIKGAGRGEAVDAVFAFDLSYSMGGNDGNKSRLERAQEEALKIIDELPPHSTVQIVTSAGKTRTHMGPRSPANLDQARQIVKELELVHLATNLSGGVIEAEDAFRRGQASNKELYVFSDMQKAGFEHEADKLKSTLTELKDKSLIHMVRCGTRKLKNAAIESIVPQAGVPRPGERVDFVVVVRNTGSVPMEKVRISLTVDEDEKKLKAGGAKLADKEVEVQEIPRLDGHQSKAVPMTVKLAKPGLSVLTARIDHDDLPGDNRFDQVVFVRDQVRILVVDGNPDTREPEKASSFALMHALMPVKENERPFYKYHAQSVPVRDAAPLHLANQDVCILVNCSLQAKGGKGVPLSNAFVESLDQFVREGGRGLIIFSGDNVQPNQYNQILGSKYGLLPARLKPAIKSGKEPFVINRDSFGKGPATFWRFKEDDLYKSFDDVPVWQHIELDASDLRAVKKTSDAGAGQAKEVRTLTDANAAQVIVALNTGKPLMACKKADKGEVIFVGTAPQSEGSDPKTQIPNWSILHLLPHLVYLVDSSVNHLLQGQTQAYNVVTGQSLTWHPQAMHDHTFDLVDPSRNVTRLGKPLKIERDAADEKDEGVQKKRAKYKLDRAVLLIADLHRAGVYRVMPLPKGSDSADMTDPDMAIRKGTPLAVVPDPAETDDLATLSADDINRFLEFTPIHIVAGEEKTSTGEDRLNREWTVWALLAVLLLLLIEVVLAWWCGRAW